MARLDENYRALLMFLILALFLVMIVTVIVEVNRMRQRVIDPCGCSDDINCIAHCIK